MVFGVRSFMGNHRLDRVHTSPSWLIALILSMFQLFDQLPRVYIDVNAAKCKQGIH